MIARTLGTLCVTTLVATAGLGLYRIDHGGEDWLGIALEREAAVLQAEPTTGLGDDGYHDVQAALDRVPLWSADYRQARAWSQAIARERRFAAGRKYAQLGYPDRWPLPGGVGVAGDGEAPAPASDEAAKTGQEPRVSVFVTSWCPYCRQATAHLTRVGVAYREVDVERDPAGREELNRKAPFARGVPVLEIDGEILLGYDEETTDTLLREAGLLPAKG